YGQKDPLVEYKKESYELFTAMMDRIEDETVRYLYFLQVHSGGPAAEGPYPEEDEGEDGDGATENGGGPGGEAAPVRADASEQQRQAAKATMEDFTKSTLRKKERELADLQFGGDGS